ncbi:MAG: helix-turn-helix domain-containing protein [Sphaerochaeta sp.]|jgi:transcriptional regulator with XRE-family HTH domain|uniref:helix-turn-helix domain-containing protein n=1 Tax=Sphaerochaeta sp. TaxID=1972642 RepID=UPI002A0A5D68|nr:helix-turn-helix transcriptional regulator [uncultured Sphaerochaeta sp.]
MTIDMDSIGKRLQELRLQSGLKQKHIADYLGVDQSLIARFESGDRGMTTSTLEKLATLYCCPVSTILSGEPCDSSIQFSFRANDMNTEDLEALAAINAVVLNQMAMDDIDR